MGSHVRKYRIEVTTTPDDHHLDRRREKLEFECDPSLPGLPGSLSLGDLLKAGLVAVGYAPAVAEDIINDYLEEDEEEDMGGPGPDGCLVYHHGFLGVSDNVLDIEVFAL